MGRTRLNYRNTFKFIDLSIISSPVYQDLEQLNQKFKPGMVRSKLNKAFNKEQKDKATWNKSLKQLILNYPPLGYLKMLKIQNSHIIAVRESRLTRSKQIVADSPQISSQTIRTRKNKSFLLAILHKIFEHQDLMQAGATKLDTFMYFQEQAKQPYKETVAGYAVVYYFTHNAKICRPVEWPVLTEFIDSLIDKQDDEKDQEKEKENQTMNLIAKNGDVKQKSDYAAQLRTQILDQDSPNSNLYLLVKHYNFSRQQKARWYKVLPISCWLKQKFYGFNRPQRHELIDYDE